MTNINFLPQSYLQQRRQRHGLLRQYALLAVVAVGMVGWYFSTQQRLEGLTAYVAGLEEAHAAAELRNNQVMQLDQREKLLRRRVQLQRELIPPVNVSSVIALLSQVMPESVAMESLTIEQTRPVVQASAVKDKGMTPAAKPAPAAPRYLTVDLLGVAPSGLEVATLVGVLEEHPIFDRVRMEDTRTEERGGLQVRIFRLTTRVSLDREYQPVSSPPAGGGFAGAKEASHDR